MLTEVAKAKLHGYLISAAKEVSYAITLRDDYDVRGYINLEFIQAELRHKAAMIETEPTLDILQPTRPTLG
jgi:hypothetical protein